MLAGSSLFFVLRAYKTSTTNPQLLSKEHKLIFSLEKTQGNTDKAEKAVCWDNRAKAGSRDGGALIHQIVQYKDGKAICSD